jgi:hypothetical protein
MIFFFSLFADVNDDNEPKEVSFWMMTLDSPDPLAVSYMTFVLINKCPLKERTPTKKEGKSH